MLLQDMNKYFYSLACFQFALQMLLPLDSEEANLQLRA